MNDQDAGLRLREKKKNTGPEALKVKQEDISKTSVEKPNETANMTALQKHSAFFDRDHDGKFSGPREQHSLFLVTYTLFSMLNCRQDHTEGHVPGLQSYRLQLLDFCNLCMDSECWSGVANW
jgi:Caleosin related protein